MVLGSDCVASSMLKLKEDAIMELWMAASFVISNFQLVGCKYVSVVDSISFKVCGIWSCVCVYDGIGDPGSV